MLKTTRARVLIALLPLCGSLGYAAAQESPAAPAPATDANSSPLAPLGEQSAPVAPQRAPDDAAELRALEDELAAMMDELITARARAGVLAQALFQSELEVEVVRRADALNIEQLTLRVDGAPVHAGDGSALSRDRATLFTGHVAPGMHELTLELSERARENAQFGYVRSERFRIDVKPRQRTRVELVVRDDSDMAEQANDGDDGSYEVSTELRVRYGKVRD